MVTLSAVIATPPVKPVGGASNGVPSGDFSRVLAGAGGPADAHRAAIAAPPPPSDNDDDRQDIAAGGKDVPDRDDDHADPKQDSSADPTQVDLAWLVPPTLIPALPLPVAVDNGAALGASSAATPAVATVPPVALALQAATDPSTADQAPDVALPTAQAPAPPTSAATPSSDPVLALAAALRDGVTNQAASAASDADDAATPPQPAPLPVAANAPTPATAPVPSAQGAALAAIVAASAPRKGSPAAATPPALTDATPDAATASTPDQVAATPDNGPSPTVKASAPQTPSLADATDTRVQAPVVGVIQSAARAFAASIAAAVTPITIERDARDPASDGTGIVPTPAALTNAATGIGTGSATIDTRHSQWVADVIDHIEQLRDAADARDTRIRLLPDALGKIDVSLRRDGDAVNVRFVADRPETRQLLADAQPKLTEIAAQRGIRIGQSTIDSGQGGQQQRQPDAPRQPIANRLPVNSTADDSNDPDQQDGWIA